MMPTERLVNWYKKECNDEWEHTYGVCIDTLDNPGWSLRVDLSETELVDVTFPPLKCNRSEDDWVHCYVIDEIFCGYGGVYNLDELITIFVDWAEKVEQDRKQETGLVET
ncbi:MAG: immunity 53 family protein [Magnetococcus sp. DMHC-1]